MSLHGRPSARSAAAVGAGGMSPQRVCRYHTCLISLEVPKLSCLTGGSVPEARDTVRYEGYGPGGTAVLVDAAASEALATTVRQIFRAWGDILARKVR